MNVPDSWPVPAVKVSNVEVTMFTGLLKIHAGVAQAPASAMLKLTPVTVIVSPTTLLDFDKLSLGITVKTASALSPRLP